MNDMKWQNFVYRNKRITFFFWKIDPLKQHILLPNQNTFDLQKRNVY